MIQFGSNIKASLLMSFVLMTIMALLTIVLCSPHANQDELESNSEPDGKQESEMSHLLDFEQYQRLFGKHYDSDLEATTRRVYLLSNVLQIYTAAVAYKYGKQGHYLALNPFSDLSPRELDMMINKVMAGAGAAKDIADPAVRTDRKTTETQDPAGSSQEQDPAKIARTLEVKLRAILKDPRFGSVFEEKEKRRTKRDVTAPPANRVRRKKRQPPRHLTVDQLIQGKSGHRPPWPQVKVNTNPKPENDLYDGSEMPHIMSRGLMDQQERLTKWTLTLAEKSPGQIDGGPNAGGRSVSRPGANLSGSKNDQSNVGNKPKKALEGRDEIIHSLVDTGCFFPPRNQGVCGACYAFAAVAIMEYRYCKAHGELVPFSEQYMIDCGKGRIEGLAGCAGGVPEFVPEFIHNFGMELEQHYPYQMGETECPYNNDTDLKTTGFVRMDFNGWSNVTVDLWPIVLMHTPFYVGVGVSKDFPQYAGGVDDGQNCPETTNHAMVLVGHGRENGQEYWLFRNSHGEDWGQRGHYKLSKTAPKRCIFKQMGFAYGTKDGNNYAHPVANKLNLNWARVQKEREQAELERKQREQKRAKLIKQQQQAAMDRLTEGLLFIL